MAHRVNSSVAALVGGIAMVDFDRQTSGLCFAGAAAVTVLGLIMIAPFSAASQRLRELPAKIAAKKTRPGSR